jgi:hypothetical protein
MLIQVYIREGKDKAIPVLLGLAHIVSITPVTDTIRDMRVRSGTVGVREKDCALIIMSDGTWVYSAAPYEAVVSTLEGRRL